MASTGAGDMRHLIARSKKKGKSPVSGNSPDQLPPQNDSDTEQSTKALVTGAMTSRTDEAAGYGLLLLTDNGTANTDIDIVFLHGLRDHRKDTWTYRRPDSTSCFWPQDLLPQDMPNARIFTFGYDADIAQLFHSVSVATLDQHAQGLCAQLSDRADCDQERPIIFVAHSMGGIVTKKMVLLSNDANLPRRASVAKDTHGIVFLGTPHAGAGHADFASYIVALLNVISPGTNVTYTKELKEQNPQLQDLERRFGQYLERRKESDDAVDVRCFAEEMPMYQAGLVVPAFSATPSQYEACQPLHATHVDMTKFDRRNDEYNKVLNALKSMMESIKAKQDNDHSGDTKDEDATKAQVGSVKHVGTNDRGAIANYGNQTFGSGSHYGNNNKFN